MEEPLRLKEDMVERVARALHRIKGHGKADDLVYEWHPESGTEWQIWEPAARAAIEAMREPTEEMVLAMIGAAPRQSMRDAEPFDGQAIFRAAIDSALQAEGGSS